MLITGSAGSELPGAVAVAVLSASFDDARTLVRQIVDEAAPTRSAALDQVALQRHRARLSKDDTRRRLQWLIASAPQASPSRGYLLRVNEVLLSPARRAAATATTTDAGGQEKA